MLPRRSSIVSIYRAARPRLLEHARRTFATSEFLTAGLVNYLHVVVVRILLGRGMRLWDGLEGLEKEYRVEATSSPSGVTHVTFTR